MVATTFFSDTTLLVAGRERDQGVYANRVQRCACKILFCMHIQNYVLLLAFIVAYCLLLASHVASKQIWRRTGYWFVRSDEEYRMSARILLQGLLAWAISGSLALQRVLGATLPRERDFVVRPTRWAPALRALGRALGSAAGGPAKSIERMRIVDGLPCGGRPPGSAPQARRGWMCPLRANCP